MNNHGLATSTQIALAVFYFLAVLLNLGYAAYQYRVAKNQKQTVIGSIAAGIFLILALGYLFHAGWTLPGSFRDLTTSIMGAMGGQAGPILYVSGAVIGFALVLYFREFFTEPAVAWTILNLS